MSALFGLLLASVTVLPRVEIYASRIGDTADEMPAAVRVLDTNDLARSTARDLPSLLERKAGVQVRTLNANPFQSQLALRGYGENSFGRVKVLLDGEELNSPDMEPPNLARIPLANVRRVEIIPGPSPVLYGDGASAGVVSITSDSRDYERRTCLSASGGSDGAAGAGVSTRGGLEPERLRYSAAYDYSRSDGFRDRTGYDLHALSASLRKDCLDGSELGLRVAWSDGFYEMPGALSYAQWKRDRRQAAYQDDHCRVWSVGAVGDARLNIDDDRWLYINLDCSYRNRRSSWGDYGYANEYGLFTSRPSLRYVDESDLAGYGNKLTLGVEGVYDDYAVRDRSGLNNRHYCFRRFRGAVFGQNQFFLTEALSFVAGARGEGIFNRWHRYRGLRETDSFDLLGDFELGLVYRPIEGFKTYAKGTRFHRSAFCDELNFTEDGRFLEPETGWSLDAGCEWRMSEEFTADFAGYWTSTDDEIFYNPHAKDFGGGAWGGYNCNSPGRTERIGFDVGVGWAREKVAEASVRYGFVDARFRDGQYAGEEVPAVAGNRVRAEVGVWIHRDLELRGGYRFLSSQVLAGDFANDHARLAGRSLFDCGFVYEPSWAEGWKLTLDIDNLLDRDYCDFAGWSDYAGVYCYPACGRKILLSIAYVF